MVLMPSSRRTGPTGEGNAAANTPQSAGVRPGSAGGRGDGGGRSGGGARGRGRVFEPAGDHVAPVTFKSGISDDDFTEVAAGELHPGDEVVLDVVGGSTRAPSGAGSGMGGGARRPLRFF